MGETIVEIRIFVGPQGGLVHEAAHRIVRHEQAVEFLLYQFRCLAAQNDLSTPQVCLQFVQGVLDFPTLVIDCSQFSAAGAERWSRIVVIRR